jgi:general secretion pathway protein B
LIVSFILDALRKSEHERQRQGGPGIADLKPVSIAARLPLWAIALGALLLLNIIVVLVLVLRDAPASEPARAPESPAAAVQPPATAAVPATPTTASNEAPPASQYTLPPPVLTPEPPQYEPEPAPLRADAPPPVYQEPVEEDPGPQLDATSTENLPSLYDIQIQGSGRVPEMHLDLHVYSSRPGERFVFLNGRKYREGGQTPEGTRIERITPDGVVLNHRGLRFLMPRQ